MDRKLLAACLAAGVGLGLAAPCAGADEKVTVADVRLGESASGPEVKADDLKGRVVLLKFWGVH